MAPALFTSLPYIEDSQKRVRVLFAGSFIADSKQAKLVWEHRYFPQYYFPLSDIDEKYLGAKQGDAYDIVVGQRMAPAAAKIFPSSPGLAGLVKIVVDATDVTWFEEDEPMYGHPKDPYKRVDVFQSSRHVRVEVDGVEVANTTRPRLLFETGLPVRTYIPRTDCRLDLLIPSSLTTACPYKGVANYYHVQVTPNKTVENIVWWYRNPNLECAAINGLVAFYDEKVDVWVDGEKVARPVTKFS